jgi:hypothetical protein
MSPDLKAQLAAVAAQLQTLTAAANGGGEAPPAPPMGGGGWLQPPAAQGALPAPLGWSVVMEIQVQGPRGMGKATVDLCYGPETWQQAPQIVGALLAQGYPVKVWVPKPFGVGGGGGGWGGRG